MELNRAGNPLQIYWNFNIKKQDGEVEPFFLEDKSLRLTLITPRGNKEIKEYEVSGNVIQWQLRAEEQKSLGDYSLMLEILSSSGKVLLTSDKCRFVRITDCSCFTGGNAYVDENARTITLSTDLTVIRLMPIVPQIGPNGNWWVEGVDTGNPARGEKGDVVDASYMEFDVDDDMNLNLTFISTNDQLELDFNIDENGYLTVDK